MLSRRLSSGSEQRAAESDVSDSHLEDTQTFDPLTESPAPTREIDSGTAAGAGAGAGATSGGATGSAKPSLLSDEEWALLGGSAAGGAAGAGGAAASHSGRGTASGERTSRAVDVPESTRRFGVLDIIGTIWITLAFPFIVAAIAVRAVASGFFLRFEYFHRPGFPADEYGFAPEDRLHYGSYVVDYLHNQDSSRYLSDVVLPNGVPVFRPEEIGHMADVKSLVVLLYLVAVIAAIGAVLFALRLSRHRGPGVRHGIRFGALLTLIGVVVLGVLAFVGWERFFTGFHSVFFEDGTWQFFLDDSLIRLFPGPFWIDSGIAVGVILLLCTLVPLLLTFIGSKARRTARTEAD